MVRSRLPVVGRVAIPGALPMLVRTSRRRLLARVTVTLWLALSLAACRAVSRPPAVAPSAPALPAHHLVPLPASIDVLHA